ncbi:hypothetical protein RHSIM_Rhsim05G0196600 [Rhododendron simsii]|uniref:Uncharacterized protein n=1 Tax=Rhododendron simsii TaxID=118357 RepID=A0A834GVQ8_RHOSS|nr:hypothetical protein RHSIM_Rhsim05G0196600 [Rhododendron simsii]
MASSATSSSAMFTSTPMSLSLGTIINYVSIRLDETNYLLWRSQFVPILVANDLYGYVDGSISPPSRTIQSSEGKNIPNAEFLSWRKTDQFVLSCINATLTQGLFAQVLGGSAAHEVWESLHSMFLEQSQARFDLLKGDIQSIQKGTSSISDYLNQLKHLADSLAALQHPVPDYELVGHALNGLGTDYTNFVVMMENRDPPPTFAELRSRLFNHEQRLKRSVQHAPSSENTALMSTRGSNAHQIPYGHSNGHSNELHHNSSFRSRQTRFNQPRQNQGNNRYPQSQSHNHGRGQGFRGKPYLGKCQICREQSHSAFKCPHRFKQGYNPQQVQQSFAAMNIDETPSVAQPQNSDPCWYPDTGATSHMTAEMPLLQNPQEYSGSDSVMVGNGAGLRISHTGDIYFHKFDSKFQLEDVLCVPAIKKNLLSVGRFTIDNNCSFHFFPWGYCVKDLATGKILLKGPIKDNLYPPHLFSGKPRNADGAMAKETAFLSSKATPEVWHNRLGHPNFQVVSSLSSNKCLEVSGTLNKNFICAACQLGKTMKVDSPTLVTHQQWVNLPIPFATLGQDLSLPTSMMTPPSPPSIPSDIDGPDPTSSYQALDISPRDPPITSSPVLEPPSTQDPLPANNATSAPLPLQPVPTHPMVTPLKDGIVKPKHHFYLTTKYPIPKAFVALLPSHETVEPSTFNQASKHPNWCAAMQDEFNALMSNGTWADSSMFVFRSSAGIMVLLLYVDDIILTSTCSSLLHSLINILNTEFAMKDLGDLHYFLGIEAKRTPQGLHFSQSKYALSLLSRTTMLEAKPCSTPVPAGSKLSLHDGEPLSDPSYYRQIVGALQYLTMTRPDLTYVVNQACQFMHSPTTVHLQAVKRILRFSIVVV